nr:MAG TPA: hypothetical protein [Caudoviricetes sp.]
MPSESIIFTLSEGINQLLSGLISTSCCFLFKYL